MLCPLVLGQNRMQTPSAISSVLEIARTQECCFVWLVSVCVLSCADRNQHLLPLIPIRGCSPCLHHTQTKHRRRTEAWAHHRCDVDKITFKAPSQPVYSPVTIIFLGWDVSDLHCAFGFLTRTAELPFFLNATQTYLLVLFCFFIICPMRSGADKPRQKGEEFIQTCEGCRGNAGDIRQTYLVVFVLFCCSLNLHKKTSALGWQGTSQKTSGKLHLNHCNLCWDTQLLSLSSNTAHGAAMQLVAQWCIQGQQGSMMFISVRNEVAHLSQFRV